MLIPKQIFIINGAGGVGKDTFCDLCGRYASVYVVSSITPAKDLARQIGWTGGKTEKDRKFLSDLKDLMTEYNDYPMTYLTGRVRQFKNQGFDEIMFMHIREPREIAKAAKAFNAKTLLISNPSVAPITSNHADYGVYDYAYDYHIINSGTIEDLEAKARDFVLSFAESEDDEYA